MSARYHGAGFDYPLPKLYPRIEKLSDTVYKLGPLGEPKVLCSYLIVDKKICVVDCGPTSVTEELFDLLKECGVSPGDIDTLLLTHIHIDHAGGASDFIAKCPKANALVPERGYRYLLEPEILNSSARKVLGDELFDSWGPLKPLSEERVRSMDQNETIEIGRSSVRYVEAKGHAPHHDVILLREEAMKKKILFAADALGIYDNEIENFRSPTTPPPSFNFERNLLDIKMIEEELAPDLICLAHFRPLVPTREFYSETIELYKNWERVIGEYLSEKNIEGASLSKENIDEIFDRLAIEYPIYRSVSGRLEHQVKRVDISGFAQWFDYVRKRSSQA